MPNALNLAVNSHYKIPWIVWKRELSITVDQYDWSTTTINHGLPFIPLVIGQWSTSPNFQPAWDISVETPNYSGAGQPLMALTFGITSSVIRMVIDNNDVRKTFYLRLMAYAPPNYTGDVTPVEYNSPFRFNSHYNYPKIVMSGKAASNTRVTHNLGYIPQAQVWGSMMVNGVETVVPGTGIVTETTLSSSTTSDSFYYYIFGDKLL